MIKITPKKPFVTRDEIARAAGVSSATVSYVVNSGPRPVAPETRTKVLEAIERLDYRPNAVARSLRLQKTSTLGLILPDTLNPYFAEVARGIEKYAFENGYTVSLCHSDYSVEREIEYVNVMQDERAAGVIWFPATADPKPGLMLAGYKIPMVVLDRKVSGLDCPSIVADNYKGSCLATQYLIDLGHREIGFIARPFDLQHSQERIKGFIETLRENGLSVDPTHIVKGGFHLEDGRAASFQLFDQHPTITAIFAYNDLMAIGALRAAYERSLRVPQELSIVGFDDLPQARFTCPALTTVQQPKFEMGKKGAELLLDLINGKSVPKESLKPLKVQLVVRESAGAAPQSSERHPPIPRLG
jgi:LacI family transcriptional regulator